MKRKHAEMIKAWADDDGLVCFVKPSAVWVEVYTPIWYVKHNYFLCLPQHKEACLHWLNGGEVQYRNISSTGDWCDLGIFSNREWRKYNNVMINTFEFRIKPKKEKWWLGIEVDGGLTTNAYKTRDEVVKIFGGSGAYQIIQIEVEV